MSSASPEPSDRAALPPPAPPTRQAIADYAVIGDCRSAALVGRNGSIDWYCTPRFDSPSLFGALLDTARGGHFRICARDATSTSRAYVPDTNVLETTFETASGRLKVIDLMPVASQADKQRDLLPDHELIRAIECVDGVVDVELACEPRLSYGRRALPLTDHGPVGYVGAIASRQFVIRTDAPTALSPDRTAVHGRFRLHRGERRYCTISTDAGHPAILPVLGAVAGARIDRSIAWWRQWARSETYRGRYREAVVRSALALKLMSYAPSGAMIAAPTTSLPAWVGGDRNWDYRYCWLRDASFTVRALIGLGHELEARAFLDWLLHATRLTWPELQILYDVYGEHRIQERELDYLAGYRESRPVRVGNAASEQLQLDVYGEVVDAVRRFVRMGGTLDRATARMLIGLGETVCRRWREPDEGIWEVRSGRWHHTLSKAMCWVALDRLIALHTDGHLRAPIERFRRARSEIREEIEARGYNTVLDSYVSRLDGDQLDASLLLLGLYQYADPAGPRMVSTVRRIYERLARGNLLYRYLGQDDGLRSPEGAFGIAGFWGVQCLAQAGECVRARDAFEALCAYGNDVGLFAEGFDPETGDALGNFPQAFTHIGLINAALTLEACERGRDPEQEIEAEHSMAEEQV
jgi:GH15 family glucan-1,4-alpha-glucosidase